MIETEFKKALVKAQRSYFTTNISDDEIFQLNMDILSNLTHTLLGDYSPVTLVKILSYYLINSNDNKELKKEISEKTNKFVEFANNIGKNRTELYVLDEALTGFEDGGK